MPLEYPIERAIILGAAKRQGCDRSAALICNLSVAL